MKIVFSHSDKVKDENSAQLKLRLISTPYSGFWQFKLFFKYFHQSKFLVSGKGMITDGRWGMVGSSFLLLFFAVYESGKCICYFLSS